MLSDYLRYLIYFAAGSILITAITLVAERKSTKMAGIMMSLPVITFLSLLFLAFSQGVYFSSRAAVWNPIGAIADLAYMGMFAGGTRLPGYIGKSGNEDRNKDRNKDRNEDRNDRTEKIKEIICGLLLGFAGYFLFVFVLSRIPVTSGFVSLALLWAAAAIFYMLFKGMREKKAERVKPASSGDIVFRGLFGGSAVAAAVILGDSAGYVWGGLFSSFPGTITPVLVLLHLKNGKDMSCGVIKSAPIGLSGTGLYSCMVWLMYPLYGVIAGTFISYLAVAVFLFAIFFVQGGWSIFKSNER